MTENQNASAEYPHIPASGSLQSVVPGDPFGDSNAIAAAA
mgnify:CR=1 FL=1